MNGWISVAFIIAVQLAVAFFAIRLAARRWWDYAIIAALSAVLVAPCERYVTGDVSRYLPQGIWSDGADGKDQIIDASIASTILLPLIAAAIVVYAIKRIWRSSRPANRNDLG